MRWWYSYCSCVQDSATPIPATVIVQQVVGRRKLEHLRVRIMYGTATNHLLMETHLLLLRMVRKTPHPMLRPSNKRFVLFQFYSYTRSNGTYVPDAFFVPQQHHPTQTGLTTDPLRDLLVVSTLDGTLTAVDRISGEVRWVSKDDKPMIQVPPTTGHHYAPPPPPPAFDQPHQDDQNHHQNSQKLPRAPYFLPDPKTVRKKFYMIYFHKHCCCHYRLKKKRFCSCTVPVPTGLPVHDGQAEQPAKAPVHDPSTRHHGSLQELGRSALHRKETGRVGPPQPPHWREV